MVKQKFGWFVGALATVIIPGGSVIAEDTGKASLSGGENNGRLEYMGDHTRLGIGVDSDGEVSGEVLHVFGETDTSNFIGEGWGGSNGAGLKLNYHWLVGDEDNVDFVSKVFIAVDQNEDLDRKATFGAGLETEKFFAGAYGSKSISDSRELSRSSITNTDILTGTDSVGAWRQEQNSSLLTRRFAKAYDYGVGLRVGKYMEQGLWRFRLGADYEWGDYNAEQYTYSAGVEKFISGTGHSVALNIEHADRSGDFDADDTDTRAMLTWRYAFGENYRPAVKTKKVKHVIQEPGSVASEKTEHKIVKHEVDMKADAFFDLDSSTMREEHLDELRKFAEMLQEKKILGKISLVGHTCDLGTDQYNQGLSERRANSVKAKLIEYGVEEAMILTEGRGETQPRYPNDGEPNRSKNRRVDIHFLLVEEERKAIPAVEPSERIEWRTEVVEQPAIWHKRALVNPIQHKRRVDAYHYEKAETVTTTGDKVYINREPMAVADSLTAASGSGASLLDVLANDRDDDGNPLTIISVTQPAGGTVENFGDLVSFTPNPDFVGDTWFDYTVSDGQGGESTARVTVSVTGTPAPTEPNQAPVANHDTLVTGYLPEYTVNVLDNDSDLDGDSLTITGLDNVPAENIGVYTFDGPNITFRPGADWDRKLITITYNISDGRGGTDSANLNIIDP
jgi:outer membrane protein OmpA-like peptidoglycan-associated protein